MQDPPSFRTVYLHKLTDDWRGGDRNAADELLRAVSTRLDRLARKMLRNFPHVRDDYDTADVLQGACMRLLAALRTVVPNSTREFFGLSALQIRRELLDLARSQARRPVVALEQAEVIVDQRPTNDADLDAWASFHEAVDRLPTEEREVVGLVFYHGWTQQQVAELLGVSDRQVRRYWTSACTTLHRTLGDAFPLARLARDKGEQA